MTVNPCPAGAAALVTLSSVARDLEGVHSRDRLVLDPLHVLAAGRAIQLHQLLAEVVQREAHDIEEVPTDALHQHAAQGLDPVAAGLVPARGGRRQTGAGGRHGEVGMRGLLGSPGGGSAGSTPTPAVLLSTSALLAQEPLWTPPW